MQKSATILTLVAVLFLSVLSCSKETVVQTHLTLDENRFQVNGKPFDMWGIRVASASQTQAYTDHLISQLDDYRAHGVNTVIVYLQGSSGGYSNPFDSTGTRIDPGHLGRMKQIIDACNQRGMITIVGIFYQRTIAHDSFADSMAVIEATRLVAKEFSGYSNIIINIANEQNSSLYTGWQKFDFRNPDNIIHLCKVIHEINPHIICGGGGYDHDKNEIIGLSNSVDVLLFDTLGPARQEDSGFYYDRFVNAGITDKPIVNVEMFGAWSRTAPAGVYTDGDQEPSRQQYKAIHLKEIDAARERPGLSVFFHSNNWCQGPSVEAPVRYHLGGQGTPDDPGIHWYFDAVQAARSSDRGS